MSTAKRPAEILRRTAALAKTEQNLEMMDCVAVLHGYVELSAFRPEDASRQKEVEDAVGMLLRAASRYPHWLEKLSDLRQADAAESVGAVT
jgi:hypothetical protein